MRRAAPPGVRHPIRRRRSRSPIEWACSGRAHHPRAPQELYHGATRFVAALVGRPTSSRAGDRPGHRGPGGNLRTGTFARPAGSTMIRPDESPSCRRPTARPIRALLPGSETVCTASACPGDRVHSASPSLRATDRRVRAEAQSTRVAFESSPHLSLSHRGGQGEGGPHPTAARTWRISSITEQPDRTRVRAGPPPPPIARFAFPDLRQGVCPKGRSAGGRHLLHRLDEDEHDRGEQHARCGTCTRRRDPRGASTRPRRRGRGILPSRSTVAAMRGRAHVGENEAAAEQVSSREGRPARARRGHQGGSAQRGARPPPRSPPGPSEPTTPAARHAHGGGHVQPAP